MSFCCVGTLPADLARLPSLAFLDLSHNQLTGSLDDFGAALTGSNNLLQVCCTKHAQLSAVHYGCCFVLTVQFVLTINATQSRDVWGCVVCCCPGLTGWSLCVPAGEPGSQQVEWWCALYPAAAGSSETCQGDNEGRVSNSVESAGTLSLFIPAVTGTCSECDDAYMPDRLWLVWILKQTGLGWLVV
jgi:hypothetical protein